MSKKIILILTIFFSSISLFAQEKTEVLFLATYHLGGTTSDNVKITDDNILSDKKQKQIDMLLKKIEKFKPQKIYVENEPNRQQKWDSILKSYNNGNKIELETELFQIAIKLASRLKLNEITCVDWHVHTTNTFSAKKYNDLVKDMIDYENET
ncbi:DUF5694 domain-containing protein [Mesonia maritima]|uniref:DUF5694 domain-containing protein n=1 Tax=Mesonia maritima TaxID=1793873 RepID=UPI00363B2D5A